MLGVRDDKTDGGTHFESDKASSSWRGTDPQSRTFTFTLLKADDGAVSVAMLVLYYLLGL